MKKAFLILSLLLVFTLAGCSEKGVSTGDILTPDEAKAMAEDFINNNLIPQDNPNKATISEVTEESDLYKLKVEIAGDTVDSYLTKDGKTFLPQGSNIEELKKEMEANNQNQPSAETGSASQPVNEVSNKTEVPNVELFVMSHCPYGTQMEKAILPVVKALGDKINFDLKFCDYAMHDKKEVDEQLREYCIQKDQGDKLIPYLECFLADGDSGACINQTAINKTNLDSCVAQADKEFGITEAYNDKSTWKGSFPSFSIYAAENNKYGISGSPALVINEENIQASRNPKALLDLICSAFETQPEECKNELSNSSPTPGFGYGASGSDTSASCG